MEIGGLEVNDKKQMKFYVADCSSIASQYKYFGKIWVKHTQILINLTKTDSFSQ